MRERVDLLEGNTTKTLIKLALPIVGSSFLQVAYNLVDTAWVGAVGSSAITALGTAGLLLWFWVGIGIIPQMGGQILMAQALGADDKEAALKYAETTVQMMIALMLIGNVSVILFRGQFVSFFNLRDPMTVQHTEAYLFITSFGLVSMGFAWAMTGLLTATGDSAPTFRYNSAGLIMNMVLDPLMIFGLGPFPKMGVEGAGLATMLSQIFVAVLFIKYIIKDKYIFSRMRILKPIAPKEAKEIAKLGFPPAIQSIGFACITMVISRFVVTFGDANIAIQRIGSQIESITWMTADGFAVATNALVAQNYGAGKLGRVKEGYYSALKVAAVIGSVTSIILFIWAGDVYSIFIRDREIISGGSEYMHIVAVSQLFMCLEAMVTGAFGGVGKTKFPAAVSLIVTGSRIPFAMLLTAKLGSVAGVWWAISLTSVVKGTVMPVAFRIHMRKYENENTTTEGADD